MKIEVRGRVLQIRFGVEDDRRIIAEIPQLPGVLAYGATSNEALERVRVLADDVIEGGK